MNADVYHPVNYKETDNTLKEIDYLLGLADELYRQLSPTIYHYILHRYIILP